MGRGPRAGLALLVCASGLVLAGCGASSAAVTASSAPAPATSAATAEPAAASTSGSAAPAPTAWATVRGSAGAPSCTGPFPVEATVVGATGPARRDTVPLPGGRVATRLTWRAPAGRLDVQWPPSPRALTERGTRTVARGTLENWSGTLDARGLSAHGIVKATLPGPDFHPTLDYTLTLAKGAATTGVRACDTVQVRLTTPDGATETVGYRLGAPDVYDLDPLVGTTTDVAGPVPAFRSLLCTDAGSDMRQTTPTVLFSANAFPSAAEALRAFLASPQAAPLDVPTLRRPWTDYRVRADGSHLFEHYTNFSEHDAVRVVPAAAGWSVTGWTSSC